MRLHRIRSSAGRVLRCPTAVRIADRIHCDDARVRWVVPSCEGKQVAAAIDQRHPTYSPTADRTHLIARTHSGWSRRFVADIPAMRVYATDDEALILVDAAHDAITISRATPTAIDRWVISGLSLSDPEIALISARELLVRATDRDDGHGYSAPEYSRVERTVDLRSGKIAAADAGGSMLRGPGTPLRSSVADLRVDRCIAALPFRREWPVCVGKTRLLTTSRLIAWQTQTTVVGHEEHKLVAFYPFFDVSRDERCVAGRDGSGLLQMWRDGAAQTLDLGAETTCAAFVDGETLAAGTATGDVVIVEIG